jgi:hypothetical protein
LTKSPVPRRFYSSFWIRVEDLPVTARTGEARSLLELASRSPRANAWILVKARSGGQAPAPSPVSAPRPDSEPESVAARCRTRATTSLRPPSDYIGWAQTTRRQRQAEALNGMRARNDDAVASISELDLRREHIIYM